MMIPPDKTPKGQEWDHGVSTGGKNAHAARPQDQLDIILVRKAGRDVLHSLSRRITHKIMLAGASIIVIIFAAYKKTEKESIR